jgi:prevent-host-death family protein
MNVYTYTEARQKLAQLLEQAAREGQVRITRKDGQTFVIRPERRIGSPLDVDGLDLGLTVSEIVQFVQEGSRTEYGSAAEAESSSRFPQADR